jgi:hypothetical protein
VSLDSKVFDRLASIADREHRSISAQAALYIEKAVEEDRP